MTSDVFLTADFTDGSDREDGGFRFPCWILTAVVLLFGSVAQAASPSDFFAEYCFDCHDAETQKAEIRLDTVAGLDWSEHRTTAFWERVLRALEKGEMPPRKKRHQPTTAERRAAIENLKAMLTEKSPVGGTVLRRLNKTEYENTVRQVFKGECAVGFFRYLSTCT